MRRLNILGKTCFPNAKGSGPSSQTQRLHFLLYCYWRVAVIQKNKTNIRKLRCKILDIFRRGGCFFLHPITSICTPIKFKKPKLPFYYMQWNSHTIVGFAEVLRGRF